MHPRSSPTQDEKRKLLLKPDPTADVQMNSYLTATDVQMKVIDMRIGG